MELNEILNRVNNQVLEIRINVSAVEARKSHKSYVEARKRVRTIKALLAEFNKQLKSSMNG